MDRSGGATVIDLLCDLYALFLAVAVMLLGAATVHAAPTVEVP